MRRSVRNILFATALSAAVAGSVAPAHAAPSGTKVANVFQLPCDADTCRTGADRKIPDGALAHGAIQIQVATSSSVGLDSVRLEMRAAGGSWVCMKSWTTSSENFTQRYDWDTAAWPSDCSSSGAPTQNGSYELRVIAHEKVGDGSQTSSAYEVRVNNRAAAPVWAADPAVSGTNDHDPHVELRWEANSEPDIVEYHFVRNTSDGSEIEFAVSATKPGGQGCTRDGAIYVCSDDAFPPSGFDGTYDYLLIAYRSSPATSDSCALPPGDHCVQSPTSTQRSAALVEPKPPSPTPTKTTAARQTARPRPAATVYREQVARDPSSCFTCGSYKPTLPYGKHQVLVPGTKGKPAVLAAGPPLVADRSPSEPGERPWLPLAAGLVLLMAALHLARLARRPA